MTTLYSQLLDAVTASGDGSWTAPVGDDWVQGRTLFGGLQTALAVRALRHQVPAELPLRSVQTTFIAPVPPGKIRLLPRVLRTGGSTVHTECRIVSGDDTLCLVVAIFGKSRNSAITVAPERPQAGLGIEDSREMRYVAGVTPAFTQHFVFGWAEGGFPFSGAELPQTRIHVRHREPQALNEGHVIALADTVPSPGLSVLKERAMASSMTWTLEFFDHRTDFSSESFWRMDTVIDAAGDGYLGQSAQLWTPDGRLAALSRQSVVAFG